ncbi:TIGR02611 family protein [Frankineae bacterium MT45]|nr:TIGR02611 family protein [Frankineae bacterium MT45]
MTGKGRPERPDSEGASETSASHRRFAWLERLRRGVRALPGGALAWRIGVGLLGLLIILVGIVLLPLPGPGWLIIFLGLGVWASEFAWASRLLRFARGQVRRWTDWIVRQPRVVQLLVGALGILLLAALIYAAWRVSRGI